MHTISYFEIQADEPQRACDFYGELFGWQFSLVCAQPFEYFEITTNGIRGGILTRPAARPAVGSGTNAFTCSMMVADFDAMSAKILALGGEVLLPKFPIPGRCWQGYFYDPEGNAFGIFEVDETAGV